MMGDFERDLLRLREERSRDLERDFDDDERLDDL